MVAISFDWCKYYTMATKTLPEQRLTRVLTKREVTLYAVHLLGGWERPVDTEDIAIKVAELLPGAFSWRKYPHQINLELVRSILKDSKKPQFGRLLLGTGAEGWRLSDAGVIWAAQLEKDVEAGLAINQGQAEPWAGSSDARRVDREVGRAKSSLAWQQWRSGEQISLQAVMQLFRIDDYSDAKMRDIKVARLRRLVAADQEASQLVDIAAKLALGKE
jgi:hypothetical protein